MSATAPAAPPKALMPSRPDVFVSYSRRDDSFVTGPLLAALAEREKLVWIDLEQIPPAADWRDQVLGGVAAANAFVFVISPDSLGSEICGQELARAVELNKRLIPVVRREPGAAAVPETLARPNWIWFRDEDDFDDALALLIEALESDLEWRDRHSRLGTRTAEWLAHERDASFLLRGQDLEAAETWAAQQGEHEERATAEVTSFILASRRSAKRRRRVVLGAVLFALAVAVVLAVLALIQRSQAVAREQLARSRELAASAVAVLPRDPELSVLLATEGMRTEQTAEADAALRDALAQSHVAVTMSGHRGPVSGGAAYDGSERTVVTGGADGTVRLWDAGTGRELATLRGHEALVRSVTFSPDGERVASADADGTIRLWDRASGRALAARRLHDDQVSGLRFSPDGRVLATASLDGTARLLDGRTAAPRAVLPHGGIVFGPEFDASGDRVVTGGTNGEARTWSVPSGDPLQVMSHPSGWASSAVFSPDGDRIATAGTDGTGRIWDARTGRELAVLRGHDEQLSDIAFSPDGSRIATASWDDTAVLWDRRGRRLVELEGHLDDVVRAEFSPDGSLVATTGSDTTARLWDARSGDPLAVMRGHTDELRAVAFSRDGTRLLTASDDGTARVWRVPRGAQPLRAAGDDAQAALSPDGTLAVVWDGPSASPARLYDARSSRLLRRLGGSETLVTDAAFLRDGRLVATTLGGTAARVWDSEGARVLATMEGPIASTLSVSRSGDRVLTGDLAGPSARVWDAGSGRKVADLEGNDGDRLLAAALSPDGRRAITTVITFEVREQTSPLDTDLFGGEVYAWDAGSGRRLATLDHNAGARSPTVAFSPGGRLALLTSLDGPAPVWDLRSPRPERTLRARAQVPGEVVDVAWSRDGRLNAIADRGNGGVAYLFDARTGTDVAELRGHSGEIRSVDFSPDGRWLATSGIDRTARIWDAATGKPMMELRGHTAALLSARFAADGRHVLTTAQDGTARIHDCLTCVAQDELLALVPSHVSAGRRLTPAERREYLHE